MSSDILGFTDADVIIFQQRKNEKLKQENEKLKQENEKLKQEIMETNQFMELVNFSLLENNELKSFLEHEQIIKDFLRTH